MAVTPVRVIRLGKSKVDVGGTSVVAVFGGVQGGRIVNPATAAGQGIAVIEELYIRLGGPATLLTNADTFALQPGQSYTIPPGLDRDIWVNAATGGHKFSGFIIQPDIEPVTPIPSNFPPAVNPALASLIPSYLYRQYLDDGNVAAFVDSYNELGQEYIAWMRSNPLPVYTDENITGSLLDWIAEGIYGIKRPVLSSGFTQLIGSYATTYNANLAYAVARRDSPTDVTVVTDDIFKRIMTWRLYRGDGKFFSINWLKRRIIRFLSYANGGSGNIDETYDLSVTVETPNVVRIHLPAVLNAATLKQAIDSGACELPFQYTYIVTVG